MSAVELHSLILLNTTYMGTNPLSSDATSPPTCVMGISTSGSQNKLWIPTHPQSYTISFLLQIYKGHHLAIQLLKRQILSTISSDFCFLIFNPPFSIHHFQFPSIRCTKCIQMCLTFLNSTLLQILIILECNSRLNPLFTSSLKCFLHTRSQSDLLKSI